LVFLFIQLRKFSAFQRDVRHKPLYVKDEGDDWIFDTLRVQNPAGSKVYDGNVPIDPSFPFLPERFELTPPAANFFVIPLHFFSLWDVVTGQSRAPE
jgi:hypothetical protein